ncbi:MAG: hypothetical protein ABEK17_00075 [Candidatus Aenigmatarchaeota archaeon]
MLGILSLLFIFSTIPLSFSVPVSVNVRSAVGGTVEYSDMIDSLNSTPQRFDVHWYNSKSVSCKSRLEFAIFNETNYTGYVDSVWSSEKILKPGISEHFKSYWIPNYPGNYSVVLRIHHCNDIFDKVLGNFSVLSVPNPERDIEINARNLPNSKIEVKLESNRSLEDVIIFPENKPMGWIFETESVDLVEPNKEKNIKLKYRPSVWEKTSVDLIAVTEDGMHSSTIERVAVKKEKTFWENYGHLILFLTILTLSLSNIYFYYRFRKDN